MKLDSFLFDDGWDNHKSLWKFNAGFPDGFAPLKERRQKYGADPGVWMSPWGGYSKPKQERIAFGKAAGYEIVDGGYALSGPKYYAAFRDVCLEMIQKYGVNQFKFDGTGNVDSVFPGSRFDSDFAAAIHLIGELRAAKPDLFINLTTGTWPSPFWLMHADSIWRGGEDDSTAGVGPYRERWITYRDAQTYERVVQNGAAVSAEFADAARHDLRAASQGSRQGSGQRFPQRDPFLLRHGHAAAGDVHHAVAA